MSKKILLIGGGTGGHILPLHPLVEALLEKNNYVELIVNDSNLDKTVIGSSFKIGDPKFNTIYFKAFKIHYHFNLQSFINTFKILGSIWRAHKLLKKSSPDLIFFKGGYVGFPFLLAIKYLRGYKGEVYLHESDIIPGTLGRFFAKSSDKIFSNFGINAQPLFYESKNLSKFTNKKKKSKFAKILIFGGSQGAKFINHLIIKNIETLVESYEIILVTGPNQVLPEFKHPGHNFTMHEFMEQEDLLKYISESDIVITRAGASIFQILALQTKAILIPLPTSARDHQRLNAEYFAKKGLVKHLPQNKQTHEKLLNAISETLSNTSMTEKLKKTSISSHAKEIAKEITDSSS